MEINEINKQLYESAFIQNGEYGYHENKFGINTVYKKLTL